MTAFTVNAGGVTKWDTLAGGSVNATLDTYAISNSTTLLIDCDSYQCAGHSAAFGSLDTVTYSGIGGKLKIDGTGVRVIAFTAGSGTVPAVGTTISQGGVSAKLLGVWSGWQAEPTATAAAMPATGFIKIKDKTGGSFASGALTGITATASGADVVGWIEVRGADTATITVPRVGAFEVVGDWFELGITNGTRGQVLPCPTTATVAGVFPGVWIETAAGSGVYERFAGAGSIVALASIPTDERGKIVWQTTAGIRIGNDGTNGVGFLPPAGCKVRIPNVILTCCTRTAGGSGPRVLPNAALGTRQEFVTTAAGDIRIGHCVFQWYGNFLQAFRADVLNSAVSNTLVLQEIASPLNVDNVIVSPTQAQSNLALSAVSCFAGGTIKNTLFARFSLAASSAYVGIANYLKGVTFENVKAQTLLNRGNATTGAYAVLQCADCVWTGCTHIGGRIVLQASQRCTVRNLRYADNFSGTTGTANAHYCVEPQTGCSGIMVDGVDFLGLTNVQAHLGIVGLSACYDTTVRNIGTQAARLDLGATNGGAVIVNGAGNSDGIRLQRCYASNTRTGLWAFLNSDNNVEISNVAGDYADTTVLPTLNAIARGIGMTGATTGQVSVYGTHWIDRFISATAGRIEVLANEPTAATVAQCAATGGTPRFNSAGQVALTAIGDQVTWEMPYFARGHTAAANLAPTLTGTNTGNMTCEFQWNEGAGYNGTWLTLNQANWNGVGPIDPAIGIKLKIRATCSVANAGNLLTNIRVDTVTTSAAQGANLYPLDEATVTIAANASLSGAEIRIYDLDNVPAGSYGAEIAGTESNVGATFAFTATPANEILLQVMLPGFVEYTQSLTVPSLDQTITARLTAELNA